MSRKVAYLFKRGRTSRLMSDAAYPTEFFYGYVEMARAGHSVTAFDEDDFGLGARPTLVWRVLSVLSYWLTGVHLWAAWRLGRQAERRRLNQCSSLIATTTTFGTALALLARLTLIDATVVFLSMGLGDLTRNPLRRLFLGWLTKNLLILSISKGECAYLRRRLPGNADVSYLPFGVDASFWTLPVKAPGGDPYVLSIGNDLNRDYPTLMAAWDDEFPMLKVLTSLPVDLPPENVEIVRSDWRGQVFTDIEMREIIQGALLVVLPIRKTIQPSGQSVCLQAMACGKTVILSDIEGLWDRDLMVDGETCVLVPCGAEEDLQSAVRDLLFNDAKRERIGANARAVVLEHLNTGAMYAALEGKLGLRQD